MTKYKASNFRQYGYIIIGHEGTNQTEFGVNCHFVFTEKAR